MKMSQLKMGDFFNSPYLPAERYMFLYTEPGIDELVVRAMRVSDYLMVGFSDAELTPPKDLKVDSVKPGDQFFHSGERFTKLVTPGKVQLRSTDSLAYDLRYGLRIFSTQTKVES